MSGQKKRLFRLPSLLPGSPSRAPSPPPSRPPSHTEHNTQVSADQAGSSYRAKHYVKITLNGTYELLKITTSKGSSAMLAPLSSAFGSVLTCVYLYKGTTGNRREMDRVLKSIDQLASMLAEKLKGSKDHKSLDQILKDLSKSLEKEDKKIKAMRNRLSLDRVAEKSIGAGELVSLCQAIKDALDTFYVSYAVFDAYNSATLLVCQWRENIGPRAIDFSPYNWTSLSSEIPIFRQQPDNLPAKVVAEVFPISRSPSPRSTSIAAGSAPDSELISNESIEVEWMIDDEIDS